MRVLLYLVLCSAFVTFAACKSDSGPSSDQNDGKDGGPKEGGGKHNHKPGSGLFGSDARVIELDEAGKPIRDQDGSMSTGQGGDGGPDTQPFSDGGNVGGGGDGGPHAAYVVPADPGVRGPWAVGVRTLSVDLGSGAKMPAEVWYPAQAGSELGKPLHVYELTDWMPAEARAQLPSNELPIPVPCDCYRDLPIDTDHAAFPISIAVHAFGGARVEFATLAAYWASRGFIVVAADHPQLTLADGWDVLSGGTCKGSSVSEDGNRNRDIPAVLRELRDAKEDWQFIAGRADLDKVGVTGRIGGAEFAAGSNGLPGVRLIMLISSAISGTPEGELKEVVYVTGQESSWYTDTYATVKSAFNTTALTLKPTILAGIDKAASQSPTPYCSAKSAQGLDGEHLEAKYGFCGLSFTGVLTRTDCSPEYLAQEQADAIFEYVTTAALEEALTGKDPNVAWAGFKAEWGELLQKR